jgi:plastocyanin
MALAAAGLVLLMFGPSPGEGARKPKTHTVLLEATGFTPANLTVAAGDSIVWVNKDPFPHTATSKEGGFDSKQIQSGKSWKYVASKKGEFPYVCTLHPTMKGVLQVK